MKSLGKVVMKNSIAFSNYALEVTQKIYDVVSNYDCLHITTSKVESNYSDKEYSYYLQTRCNLVPAESPNSQYRIAILTTVNGQWSWDKYKISCVLIYKHNTEILKTRLVNIGNLKEELDTLISDWSNHNGL